MTQRIALFIPVYNVEDKILSVLESIPSVALERIGEVFVIDNLSRDRTVEKALPFIRSHGKYHLFQNERNYYLGGSTILAFKIALERGYDYLICMHGDGQADPGFLSQLILHSDGVNDFVFGSRFLPQSQVDAYSLLRRAGNLCFVPLQQLLLRHKIYDIGSFISFKLQTVSTVPYSRLPHDMGYHPLLVLYICRSRRIRFAELPMRWGKVETSHVNPFVYGVKHLLRLARFAIGWAPMTDLSPKDFHTREIA